MNHPLKVFYPLGGKHIITLWWTHDEQNQVAISRNQKSMDAMIHHIICKHEDCKIKQSYEVEIVAPSKYLCDLATAHQLQKNVKLFFEMVAAQMRKAIKANYKIPPIFSKCHKWESAYDEQGQYEKDDPHHYSCRNCEQKITLSSLSKEEFYHLFHREWNKWFEHKWSDNPKEVYSLAEMAKDDDVLWGAYSNNGYHCRGVVLSEVIPDNTKTILFYYRNPISLSVLEYEEFQTKKEAQRVLLRAQKSKDWEDRIELEMKQEIEKALSVFDKIKR